MKELSFVYPQEGYLFYADENPRILLRIKGRARQAKIHVDAHDYNQKQIFTTDLTESLYCEEDSETIVPIPLPLKRLGYYGVSVRADADGEELTAFTGVGVTTPHTSSAWQDSFFGMCTNGEFHEEHFRLFKKTGVTYFRANADDSLIKRRGLLKDTNLVLTVQMQGADIVTDSRYAPPERNKAYHFQKLLGEYAAIQEHGNEHGEEHNLMLLSEWHKSSGFARLTADPVGWYTNSGCPGVDLNKLQVMYEQGVMDYITCLSIHAYSFPMAPEQEAGFWSIARLEDLGKWMDERGIDLPVACMEQGYPAMKGQTRCEVYSPGDLVTLEAQADYLVRSWLLFIMYGVSKIVWYNATWTEGFCILEKDGPAPWPAAMALAALVRAVDGCEYVGNYEKDESVWFLVFRNKATHELLGIVWRPVYLARSSERDKNYTLDGRYLEGDPAIQELFEYELHHTKTEYELRDIMGNPLEAENGRILIGERPVYIHGLTEDILPALRNRTVFHNQKVKTRALPSGIILGLCDAWIPKKEEYWSSKFTPGNTRTYQMRVHNFSNKPLKDEVICEAPDCFTLTPSRWKVDIPAGETKEFLVDVTCAPIVEIGEHKIYARLAENDAHPVYQIAVVTSPLQLEPLKKAPEAGDSLTLHLTNGGAEAQKYLVAVCADGAAVSPEKTEITIEANSTAAVPLTLTEASENLWPVFTVHLSNEGRSAEYPVVLPLRYINQHEPDDMAQRQQFILTGYNLAMTPYHGYDGPALLGNAKPETMIASSRIEIDDRYLYFHFHMQDDTLVCVKNTRRDNIDCDGVWLRLYRSVQDENPFRHFSIVPAGPTGDPAGAYVNEVSQGILFAYPFSDYDYSGIQIQSEIAEDGYIINARIDRSSLGMEEPLAELVADIRVLNMNHNDWTKFYDTGKLVYTVL